MIPLQLPFVIFKTHKQMDDYGANDMRHGDLSEEQLKRRYHLIDVSSRVDPYLLSKTSPSGQPQSMFYSPTEVTEKLTIQECASILFDEFRHLSLSFSLYGPYKHLIEKMITHMQKSHGSPFHDTMLDRALNEQILSDKSPVNSTLILIKNSLQENIDWKNRKLKENSEAALYQFITKGRLPKFNRFQDNFNGMGITVHDVWATHITLQSLTINANSYRAVIHYKVQDHFGLDSEDIINLKYNQFRFFRIWFILQHYNKFGFKPFLTNMSTTIEVEDYRNESP